MEIMQRQCKRCGHSWIQRTKKKPLVCPKCKSPWYEYKKGERLESEQSDPLLKKMIHTYKEAENENYKE